ncbi:uncharacterized protein [Bombus fervidus]|uniref:uncharacterized protein n=1 Tax=Bombus fervidus TaxID=203811 RepID=UPI003AB13A72
MGKIKLYVFLIICGRFLLSVKADDKSYCFNLTWVEPALRSTNCSKIKDAPCIDPILYSEKAPNASEYEEFWKSTEHVCSVASGNVCIKYTFTYNNEIVNTSSFCGKVIEDDIIPITSGCYKESIEGYILEICACQSRRGNMPCNSSVNVNYTVIFMITVLSFTFWISYICY